VIDVPEVSPLTVTVIAESGVGVEVLTAVIEREPFESALALLEAVNPNRAHTIAIRLMTLSTGATIGST
jgi:hypothetical protein